MDGPRQRRRRGRPRRRPRSPAGPAGGAQSPLPRSELCTLEPFAIFCAYYLGITPSDGYAAPRARSIGERFGLSPEELTAYLAEHHLDLNSVRESGFDLESAQLDIRVAPDGVSRTELARPLFEELRAAQG